MQQYTSEIEIGPWRYEVAYNFAEIPGFKTEVQNTHNAFFVCSGNWIEIYTTVIPGNSSPDWSRCNGFIEIPKTGSRSIVDALNKINGDSGPMRSYGHMYGRNYPAWVRPRLKTVVRNPFDRLVSAYHFALRGGFNNNQWYKVISDHYPTFESFVLNYLDESFLHYDKDGAGGTNTWRNAAWKEIFIAQKEWVTNDEGAKILLPENIAKFEDFDSEVERVFGLNTVAKKNISKAKQSWPTYYQNEQVAQKVRELYQDDFAFFDYSTEIP